MKLGRSCFFPYVFQFIIHESRCQSLLSVMILIVIALKGVVCWFVYATCPLSCVNHVVAESLFLNESNCTNAGI